MDKSPKVLISETELLTRLNQIALEINQAYQGKEITGVCVLKGSFIFFSDLMRKLQGPMTCEFLGVLGYPNHQSTSGEVKMTLDLHEPLQNKHVIVFTDVVSSGSTLSYICHSLRARQPASLKTCSLLVKSRPNQIELPIDYVGFSIEDRYAVGYGMDDQGRFRNLPYIGYLEHGH